MHEHLASVAQVADVLAAMLRQDGYAVQPPRQPEAAAEVLERPERVWAEWVLSDERDLESWQPCLLSVRVPARSAQLAERRSLA